MTPEAMSREKCDWEFAEEAVPLPEGEVHLWLAYYDEIADGGLHDIYRQVMNDAERQQELRFRFEKDRRRYLVTRALVRSVLSRYAPRPPAAWTFTANQYGRPEIANDDLGGRRLSFNISHTDKLVVLGIARGCDLGVDVENLSTRDAVIGIAQHYFGPNEVAALLALPADQQHHRFFEYWTFKESYIKARGMGLSLPLDGFEFSYPDERGVELAIRPHLADDPARWRFWQFRPTPEHLIALCVERNGARHPPEISIRRTVPLRSERILTVDPLRASR